MRKNPFIFFVKFLLIVHVVFTVSILYAQEKIDINRASLEELKRLPGIGEVTARNIIEYREKVGAFKNIEELKNVKGIGDKKLELLKNYITIDGSQSLDKPKSDQIPFSFLEEKSERRIYYYRDERGVLHFTQFPEMVPEKYKKTLKPFK